MEIKDNLTDSSILKEIGERINKRRLELNLTQEQLAHEAGISKRTLERLEDGFSIHLSNFLRLLRKLRLLNRIETLIPETKPKPMELLKNKGKERKRAYSKKSKEKLSAQTEPWEWGDDS